MMIFLSNGRVAQYNTPHKNIASVVGIVVIIPLLDFDDNESDIYLSRIHTAP